MALKVQLVTPERLVLEEEVESLSCPTTQGQITILPGHIPLVSTLISGELVAKNNGEGHNIHVAGGFVEVRPHNEVVILADAAEHFYEIDEQRAEHAKKQAQQLMAQSQVSSEEYALAAAWLERSATRLNIARKHAHRRNRPITSQGTLEE
jgi:F-type H+-transporting ATPase subunit epsilon